ncbi:MAG TPA: porin family protein [Flavobacteriales bacterium]|nr:porin family protein [Flavobacteriales bacterium]
MKSKIVFITLLALGISLSSKAQVAFGLKGGYTRSSLNGSHAFHNNTLEAHTIGAFVQFGGFVFAVQPEIIVTQKGGRNYEMLDQIHEEYRFSYMEIPVLLKAGIPLPNDIVFPHLFAGPYYASALTSSYEGTGTVADAPPAPNTRANFSYNRNLRENDWGMLGGAGVDVRLGRIFLSLDGRYHLGLRTLDAGGNYERREIRNGAFMLTGGLGVRFGY